MFAYRIILAPLVGVLILAGASPAQTYAPGIDAVSLIDLRYYPNSAGFLVERLQVVFPPEGDVTGELTLSDAGGETVATMTLRLERWPDFPAFAALKPVGAPTVHPNRAGDFTLSIRLGDVVIGSVDYRVEASGGDDPFDPKKTYLRTGPWGSLAYLSAPVDDVDEPLSFTHWTSTREVPGTPNRASLSLSVKRAGVEVAVSRSNVVIADASWQGFIQPLVEPVGKAPFTLADLVARDGAYTIAVTADGETLESYALQVAGGEVVPHPRSALPTEPRADFLTPRRVNTWCGSTSCWEAERVFWVEASGR